MKKIILFLVASIGMIACNNDDNTNNSEAYWVGNWKLISYSQNGFAETTHYTDGQIVWNIAQNNTINATVETGLELSDNLPIVNSGIFNYQVNQNNEMYFEAANKTYSMHLKNDTLYLNHELYADGEQIILKK